MSYQYNVSNEIYDIEKLDQACQDFVEISKISYCEEAQELSIDAENQEQSNEIFNEFMNYVLSL